MAYQEVSVSNVTAIIDAIRSFAEGLGFTVNQHTTISSNRVLTISGGIDDYAHFYGPESGSQVFTMLSIAYSGGVIPTSESSRGSTCESNLLNSGPYQNLYLFGEFGSKNYIHCVLEIASGKFRHFGIGALEKEGVWTGGDYNFGTYWSQSNTYIDDPDSLFHTTPFDSYNNNSDTRIGSIRCDDNDAIGTHPTGVDTRYMVQRHIYNRQFNAGIRNIGVAVGSGLTRQLTGFYDTSPNYFNNQVSLGPINIVVNRDNGYLTFIGSPNAMRAVSMEAYSPKDELTIGSDTWKVFPTVRRNLLSDNTEASAYFGFAYKKVV